MKESGEVERGERKGRLVEEWRNIISLSSRRGFVLYRLPSAPLHPPPLSSLLGNLYSDLSIAALTKRYACAPECECLRRAELGPFSPPVFVSEVVQSVTQLFLGSAGFALCCFLESPMWLCRGQRACLACSQYRRLLTGNSKEDPSHACSWGL